MNTATAIDLINRHAQRLCPSWALDDDNREVVTSVAAWLAREPRQNIDLNKGLLIIGNVGTGKTLLLRALREAMRDSYGAMFGIRSCAEMVRVFADEGYQGIEDWLNGPHVCFDDLGSEQAGAHYANKTNLMAEVIEARYERLSSGRKCWTHLSTNLGTDEIERRYGARAYSRLKHMCNLLDLGSSSASRDRREGAAGIAPPQDSPNADNVYSVVHPRIAERLRVALQPAVDALKAAKPAPLTVAHTSQKSDLEQFRDLLPLLSEGELKHHRGQILLNNTPMASEPFVRLIDQEIARRFPQVSITSLDNESEARA